MAVHWLDDIVELVRREGKRFAGSSPDKGAHHETAADILARLRDTGTSHEQARAALADVDNSEPHVVKAVSSSGPPPIAG